MDFIDLQRALYYTVHLQRAPSPPTTCQQMGVQPCWPITPHSHANLMERGHPQWPIVFPVSIGRYWQESVVARSIPNLANNGRPNLSHCTQFVGLRPKGQIATKKLSNMSNFERNFNLWALLCAETQLILPRSSRSSRSSTSNYFSKVVVTAADQNSAERNVVKWCKAYFFE